jgi:hypothetical protein
MVTANQRAVSKQSPHKISTHTRLKYLAILRKWNNTVVTRKTEKCVVSA